MLKQRKVCDKLQVGYVVKSKLPNTWFFGATLVKIFKMYYRQMTCIQIASKNKDYILGGFLFDFLALLLCKRQREASLLCVLEEGVVLLSADPRTSLGAPEWVCIT